MNPYPVDPYPFLTSGQLECLGNFLFAIPIILLLAYLASFLRKNKNG